MRLFRITLSHGSESITFDGAGARSGSMFHVRRDAIEGLWSSPASKVSLTERETANGASPISDGETMYAARTVVIPFAIQSNYNHTALIRARIMLGRLLGWHDVRMDINDDGDETVLYGYVEAKYSDIPYDHADTGTITLVCPDPRRVSKHEATVSMNTSSSSLGGLSFGVPAYELAWTGAANASTSTLSSDGSVVATNLIPDPTPSNASAFLSRWGNMVSYDADAHAVVLTSNPNPDSPYYEYDCDMYGNFDTFSPSNAPSSGVTVAPGDYVFAMMAFIPMESTNVTTCYLVQGVAATDGTDTWNKLWSPPFTPVHGVWFPMVQEFSVTRQQNVYTRIGFGQSDHAVSKVMIRRVSLYTAADWAAMQELGVDWFSGDTQSPQPNTGLVFPLDFGQSGNTGNTGMIDNNGSYTSMPTITAHGSLDNGITVHWNTSDGNEGDLSFNGNVGNVPVTINTDTHSAIMGGLDVSYQLGSRDWPRIPAGGSCSFALLASGNGWVTVQSHDTYM